MSVVFCGVAPHPPIAVPEVARGRDEEIKKTQEAMLELGRRLARQAADVLVLITPHGAVFSDAVGVYTFSRLHGDLGMFGAAGVEFDVEGHELAGTVLEESSAAGLPVVEVDERILQRVGLQDQLDHGVMVPLYFLRQAGVKLPLVVVSIGMLPWHKLYRLGMSISSAGAKKGLQLAVVASGDLSHRLTPDAPAGYDPEGARFDAEVVRLVEKGDVVGLAGLDRGFIERAGECGLRPVLMAFGTVDGLELEPEVLSYQGPFGVGYMVADLKPGRDDPERKLYPELAPGQKGSSARKGESAPAVLARETLEKYCRGELDVKKLNVPEELLKKRAGVFVSIKKNGQLRGCIGTIEPVRENVVEEIISNAISAGTRDPRFEPVTRDELEELEYSVDILGEPEPVSSLDELDPKEYGVIVRAGNRKGVLLPDLEGIDTAEQQVAIARQKAGIAPGEKIEIERFKVQRFK